MVSFSKRKEKVLNKFKMKIKPLKSNMKQRQTKPFLCDNEVKTYLESIHIATILILLQLTKLLVAKL